MAPDNKQASVDPVETAIVKYAAGRTINLGNFESLRVDVGIEVPASMSKKRLEKAYKFGVGWVDERLNAIVEEVMDQL